MYFQVPHRIEHRRYAIWIRRPARTDRPRTVAHTLRRTPHSGTSGRGLHALDALLAVRADVHIAYAHRRQDTQQSRARTHADTIFPHNTVHVRWSVVVGADG